MLTISLAISVFSIYYFQIKEYRVDRLIAAVREQGVLYFLLPERILLPKKSVRNMNIFSIFCVLLMLYSALAYLKPILMVFEPFFGLVFVYFGVVITGFISAKKRSETITDAKYKRAASSAIFIGITGSFGKSSTKEFLYQVLESHFATEKTIGNYNTNIGVAMSVNKNLHSDTKYFVTEMGAYKRGEIREIADWVKPTYAIITGLSNQHLSLFGSIDNLIRAKAELIQALPNGSTVYINSDLESYSEIVKYATDHKIISYSLSNSNADIYYENVTRAKYKDEIFDVRTHLLGTHNLINLLPVIVLAFNLGVPKDKISKVISELKNPFGRLSHHEGINGMEILYDGYSSNVTGFLAALEVLKTFEGKPKVILTKGIIELGKQKVESYEKILNKVNEIGAKLLTSDVLFAKLGSREFVTHIKGEKNLLTAAKEFTSGTTVLIEGRFSDKFVSALNIHE